MSDKNTDYKSGHRERLRQKFLADQLTECEQLELALTFVVPRHDMKPLARDLMKKYGGVFGIVCAPMDELIKIPGISKNIALYLKNYQKLMSNGYSQCLMSAPVFHNDNILNNFVWINLSGKNIEELHVIYLGKDNRMLKHEAHSIGTIDWAIAYPREILKRALELSATSVILAHNHLTPITSFSNSDIEMTDAVYNILKPLNIRLYDHFLVSGNIVYSARNLFLLKD